MKTKRLLFMIVAVAVLAVGCGKKPDEKIEMASPTCADLDTITDTTQKAELLKKCPRSGPAFKPSVKKEW